MTNKKRLATLLVLILGTLSINQQSFAGVNNIGFDSHILSNGGFSFLDATFARNGNSSFTMSALTDVDGSNGIFGGIGIDIGQNGWDNGGYNFVSSDYQIEVTYRPTSNNVATAFNVIARQEDGLLGGPAGSEQGEEFQFGLFDVVEKYNNGTPDADGFVTITRDLALPWDFRQQANGYAFDGDMLLDTDVHQDNVPNGITQMQLQVPFNSTDAFEFDFKSVRLAPKNPDPMEIARIDYAGFDSAFNSLAGGNAQRDDGTQFTNLILDTGTLPDVGGVLLTENIAHVETFDAADYAIEVTAKLLPNNVAPNFAVVAKDLDGDDMAAGEGAEEWGVIIETSELNASTFETVTIPMSEAAIFNATAFGFANEGDGLSSDFNLYEFHIQPQFGTSDRLNVEIESVRIVMDGCSIPGDYNDDGQVSAGDLNLVLSNWGQDSTIPPDGWICDLPMGPVISAQELNGVLSNWGNSSIQAVPEPGSMLLFAALGGLAVLRRRS